VNIVNQRPQLLARATALALTAQFILGMVVNTYVAIPPRHPGARANEFFSGVAKGVAWAVQHASWSLALHAALGLILVLAASAVLVSAITTRDRRNTASAIAGMLLIIGAGFNGGSFLTYGHALSSLLMAIFFLLAFAIYLVGFAPTERVSAATTN
jgi:hypothetical protein